MFCNSAKVIACVLAVGLSSPAKAQLIGMAVGESIRAQEKEQDCQYGTSHPPEPWQAKITLKVDGVFQEYLSTAPTGDEQAVRHLFADRETSAIAGVDGVPVLVGSGPLPKLPTTHVRRSAIVFGSDQRAARSLWTSEDGAITYAVDFVQVLGWNTWRIWRIRFWNGSAPTNIMPERFCHETELSYLWPFQ